MTPDEMKAGLALGATIMMQGRELKEISKMIRNDEKLGKGALCGFRGAAGLLVATDERVIFVSKVLFTTVVEEFTYERISAVDLETGPLRGELILTVGAARIAFSATYKAQAKDVADYIKAQIYSIKPDVAIQQTVQVALDPMDQIAKLAALKEQGIITEEEFTAKKKQLLGL